MIVRANWTPAVEVYNHNKDNYYDDDNYNNSNTVVVVGHVDRTSRHLTSVRLPPVEAFSRGGTRFFIFLGFSGRYSGSSASVTTFSVDKRTPARVLRARFGSGPVPRNFGRKPNAWTYYHDNIIIVITVILFFFLLNSTSNA